MYNYQIIWLSLLCGTLASCIAPYEPKGVTPTSGMLVVEGNIIEPYGTTIRLSRTKALNATDSYEHINSALITISCDDGTRYYTAELKKEGDGIVPGTYTVNEKIVFTRGTTYTLNIKIGDQQYQSNPVTPLHAPEIEDVNYITRNDGRQVDIRVSTSDPAGEIMYYRWACEEDWEYTAPEYATHRWNPELKVIEQLSKEGVNTYYCWDKGHSVAFALGRTDKLASATLKNNTVLQLQGGTTRFLYLYSVLVKQYAITKEAYDYFSNLQKNIEDAGSVFAPQPTELSGNIHNMANPEEVVIGFVTASTETSRRLYIPAEEVPGMNVYYYCEEEMTGLSSQAIDLYATHWRILNRIDRDKYIWLLARCVECTELGGTKDKPDWWPNDHQ